MTPSVRGGGTEVPPRTSGVPCDLPRGGDNRVRRSARGLNQRTQSQESGDAHSPRGTPSWLYGAIAVAGGAVGLLLGGALTEYLSWRWTLYVNLIFAAVAFAGGALLLARQPSRVKPKLDIPGVLLVSGAVFCLVSRVLQRSRAQLAHPLHLRVHRRRRGARRGFRGLAGPGRPPAAAAPRGPGPQPRRRLPVNAHRRRRVVRHLLLPDLLPAADARVLPASHRRRVPADQRRRRRHLQPGHHRADAQGRHPSRWSRPGCWPRQARWPGWPSSGRTPGTPRACSARSSWPPSAWAGIAPSISTGTFGVAPQDAGVASATVTVGQQLGASIGTSLLNSIFAGAVASYLTANLASARIVGRQALTGLALKVVVAKPGPLGI